ncbi:hypothetical protein PHYC_01626 [Phycisphaerales bacterium]|nr:hypothetical protein PHYC_01626 [Phycisphaerales bacterium]
MRLCNASVVPNRWRWAFVAAVGTAAGAPGALALQAPRFAVADLGTTQGSSPTGISDAGHVSGLYFAADGQRRGFLWDDGVVSDIGTLGDIAQALAVNDSGVVVGYSVDTQGRQRAVRVAGGVMSDLGVLHGGVHASANGINDLGWIAGMSQRRIGNDTFQRAALWRDGSVIDLGTFGGEYSEANAVNNAGQVVGWAWYPLPTRRPHAFLWSDSTGMIDLGTLGGYTSFAADINDLGAVVGSSNVLPANGASHAFMWTARDGMIDLGTVPGADESSAAAINNRGQVVGYSFLPIECRFEPFLWENGELQPLNELIDPDSGWNVVSVGDINDRGEIAAIARQGQQPYHAVVLVPIPQTVPIGESKEVESEVK